MARRWVALALAGALWGALAWLALRWGDAAPSATPRGIGASRALRFAEPPPRWLAWAGDRTAASAARRTATVVVEGVRVEAVPRRSPEAIDRSPEPVLPLASLAADAALLSRIAERLVAPREGTLGPYRYLGESEPPEAWRKLSAQLETAYRERTGLVPIGEPRETVVLFADWERYRAFQREQPRLAGLRAAGHAAAGLVALVLDEADREASESTFVHELVHLLNRRALGPALPPWLDEGLAESVAGTRFDPESGRFLWGVRRAGLRREGRRLETSGAYANLERLAQALAGPAPPRLEALVAREWEAFVADPSGLSYAHAREWVEFLLAGDPVRAAAFRGWLAAIARGGEVGGEALERALGTPLAALEPELHAAVLNEKALLIDAGIAALTASGERLQTP